MRPNLSEPARRSRTLLVFRLLVLAAGLALLPTLVPLESSVLPWLALAVAGLVLLWVPPLWSPFWRREASRTTLLWIEAAALAFFVLLFGGLQSPFALLFLPLLGEAAIMLRPVRYAFVASVALIGYGLALLPDLAEPSYPAWAPLAATALFLLVPLLGLVGGVLQRERAHGRRLAARLRQLRLLFARLPGVGREGAFWPLLLGRLARGGFVDAALIRYEGPRPRVIALGRDEAWNGLASRQARLLRQNVLGAGRPELLIEDAAGPAARSIVCWPVPGRAPHERPAGIICLLAERVATLEEARRHLERWLPWASLALATSSAHLNLMRAEVDWKGLVAATLRRLEGKLAHYLVLVHVDAGAIEADALLLGDAIAHVLEEALERIPPGSQVRVMVRRELTGWSFEVVTNAQISRAEAHRAGPGARLARQVIEAHGGEWRDASAKQGFVLGFRLPARGLGGVA